MTSDEALEGIEQLDKLNADAIKETLDAVEETLDAVEAVNSEQIIFRYAAFAFIASVISAFVASRITRRRLRKQFSEISRQEIEEAKNFYKRQSKPSSPAKLAEQYVEEIKERQESPNRVRVITGDSEVSELRRITESYQSDDLKEARATLEEKAPEESEPEPSRVQNVFDMRNDTEVFDYEEEEKHRSEEEPYVISHDEFMANEKDYQQTQLTYYEGDDVLADDKDRTIDEEDEVVGSANLLKFGHGSKDVNIVYIRNDTLGLEFEVVRSDGKYAELVLGFIEHSESDPRNRRFRVDRDE